MRCDSEKKDDNYDFFDNIVDYIEKEENAISEVISDQSCSCCESFSAMSTDMFKNTETAKRICVQFVKLFGLLSTLKEKRIRDSNYKKDGAFLNYWTNMQISNNMNNQKKCVQDFYDDIENHCIQSYQLDSLSDFSYDINNDDINNLNILYDLYKKYNKINGIITKQSEEPEKLKLYCCDNCFDGYKLIRSSCIGLQNKFCDQLNKFKQKYEDLYTIVEGKGEIFSEHFKRLPEDNNISIITTSVLGSAVGLTSLYFLLHKVT
ncbi:hypothetical protein PVT01_000082600 [Plasmodium vivax]|uniref:VIR protein n=1 Tax=Plasmodium vivax TaxID=5855 RepID=A0A1G4E7I5_PLAVI|nr:hypothetical protein PVT01_000082600 [Plasmodium vivax]